VAELRHAAHLREAIDGEEAGALLALGAAQRALGAAARLDPALDRLQAILDAAFAELDELARAVRDYDTQLDTDPGRLQELEARRDMIFRLTRKYGGTVDSALETLREAREELDLVDTAALDLGALSQREAELSAAVTREAQRLSAARGQAARALERAVDAIFPDLGLADGHLTVALTPRDEVAASGAKKVEYRVALSVGLSPGHWPALRLAESWRGSCGTQDDPRTARQRSHPRVRRGGRGDRQARRAVRGRHDAARRRPSPGLRHHPPAADRRPRAPSHRGEQEGSARRDHDSDLRVVEDDARVTEVARMLGGDSSEASRAHAHELLENAAVDGVGRGFNRCRCSTGRPARPRGRSAKR
jgi:DNA repair protein RecN (Recombination protein N)